jgi:alpha-D-ribose 1-methylphosphonate 5-phosphate C-P lyase
LEKSLSHPGLPVARGRRKAASGFGVGTDGTGLMAMFGKNTLTRVIVHGADSTGALTLCDAEGKEVWAAP